MEDEAYKILKRREEVLLKDKEKEAKKAEENEKKDLISDIDLEAFVEEVEDE